MPRTPYYIYTTGTESHTKLKEFFPTGYNGGTFKDNYFYLRKRKGNIKILIYEKNFINSFNRSFILYRFIGT